MDRRLADNPDTGEVTAHTVDLTNCDRELVQFPGAIQPHGIMLVVSELEWRIQQASANCLDLLGLATETLLDQPLERALGPDCGRILRNRLSLCGSLDGGLVHVARCPMPTPDSPRVFDMFVHRSDGLLIVELELAPAGRLPEALDLYSQLHAAIGTLHATSGVKPFFETAVGHIRRFSGYDRVLAYKFLEDGSGEVIAESRNADLESYLGHRYPASDIPAPARRMFGLSWLRHMPDSGYDPVPMIPERDPRTGRPVDMSYAALRSVSIMYSQYLRNMGVKSTMVMPLMREGRLWGLISCMHHQSRRHVPYEARVATEFLAHMLSLLMSAKEDLENAEYREQLDRGVRGLLDLIAAWPPAAEAPPRELRCAMSAAGAALMIDGRLSVSGRTPTEPQIRALVEWLSGRYESVLATDRLDALYPAAAELWDCAAGILAVRLGHDRPDFLIWFRPEVAQTVKWAGDPRKPVEVAGDGAESRLTPRRSFALWQETVSGRSQPWAECEVAAAEALRRGAIELMIRRMEDLRRVNEELQRSNLELDAFAFVASHDLKEPLRGIHNYAALMMRSYQGKLEADGRAKLETIMRLTRRMDDLIESLLLYSRVGRAELAVQDCHMDRIVDDVVAGLRSRLVETGTEVRRPRSLPVLRGDRVRLHEVMTNLISNAIKYNDKPPGSRFVEIGWEEGEPPILYVRDNGIGIALQHQEKIFQIFRRLHGRDEFGGGTGAGLTIARKMVERHGGRLWVQSTLGQGSTFRMTLAPGGSPGEEGSQNG